MKVCILSDIHWGARNASKYFIENYKLFYANIFFPYLEALSLIHI